MHDESPKLRVFYYRTIIKQAIKRYRQFKQPRDLETVRIHWITYRNAISEEMRLKQAANGNFNYKIRDGLYAVKEDTGMSFVKLDTDPNANNIKRMRKLKGWTLQKLADALGTSRSQVDKLERGERRLTVDWLDKVATALECSPLELLPTPIQQRAIGRQVRKIESTVCVETNKHQLTITIDMPEAFKLVAFSP